MTDKSYRETRPDVAVTTSPSTAERMTLGHYRHPSMDGQTPCPECGTVMHEHGWLDTGGDGIAVCPSGRGPFAGQTITERGLAELNAVRALHAPRQEDALDARCAAEECDHEGVCPTIPVAVCAHCFAIGESVDGYAYEYGGLGAVMYPCPTVRALDGEVELALIDRLDKAERIADAAREYVRVRAEHIDRGPLLSSRKAAHDALIAAVEAEGSAS